MIKKRQGGASIGIGTYTLKFIKSYNPKWTHIYDESNSFLNWDFAESRTYKGTRFSATIQTSSMPEEEYRKLLKVLQSRVFTFKSDDYEGNVEIAEAPVSLINSNEIGKYYTLNFTVTATTLDNSSGSL